MHGHDDQVDMSASYCSQYTRTFVTGDYLSGKWAEVVYQHIGGRGGSLSYDDCLVAKYVPEVLLRAQVVWLVGSTALTIHWSGTFLSVV